MFKKPMMLFFPDIAKKIWPMPEKTPCKHKCGCFFMRCCKKICPHCKCDSFPFTMPF